MKSFPLICLFVCLLCSPAGFAADEALLEESFTTELSPDWFWGLGTWTVKDGILRGFESGERRHGPVKMRKFPFKDATLTCAFRLERGATFAGIIFNGSQERGHLVHLVMAGDTVRVLAHPKKGETLELLKEPTTLSKGEWHEVNITFAGPTFTAMVDERTYEVTHDCIAEEKLTFGLGGDSGGPEGEKAGALEFRSLKISAPSQR
ncbi:MAG: family 16 glycoside hydrolase [Verrucomicrobiales bacterium]